METDNGAGRLAPAALPFGPLGDLVAQAPAEQRWDVEGLVGPGVLTELAGSPKVGKSSLVCGLLRALVDGTDFCGLPTRKMGSLILTEERPGSLVEKVRQWGIGGHHGLTLGAASAAPWETVVRQAVSHCQRRELGLLVVDTWPSWARLAGDAENSSGAVRAALEPIEEAAAARLAVLLVLHSRKVASNDAEDGDVVAALRGSGALAAAADVLLLLRRSVGRRRELVGVSRFEATPNRLSLVLTERGYELAEEGDRLTRVAEFLAERPEASGTEVATALGIRRQTALRAVKELRTKSEVPHVVEGSDRRFPSRRNRVEPAASTTRAAVVPVPPSLPGGERGGGTTPLAAVPASRGEPTP